jgi:hypothetical protein
MTPPPLTLDDVEAEWQSRRVFTMELRQDRESRMYTLDEAAAAVASGELRVAEGPDAVSIAVRARDDE